MELAAQIPTPRTPYAICYRCSYRTEERESACPRCSFPLITRNEDSPPAGFKLAAVLDRESIRTGAPHLPGVDSRGADAPVPERLPPPPSAGAKVFSFPVSAANAPPLQSDDAGTGEEASGTRTGDTGRIEASLRSIVLVCTSAMALGIAAAVLQNHIF